MVDFEFYVNDYLGSAIPEKAFSGVAAQAQHWLQKFEFLYRVEASGVEAKKMAVCAMAETLWARRSDRIAPTRYSGSRPSLGRELYQQASIYLDIYRGVRL